MNVGTKLGESSRDEAFRGNSFRILERILIKGQDFVKYMLLGRLVPSSRGT